MRLLILMSDTGGGHRSAAEAIAAALKRVQPGSSVELLDFFATCAPFPLNRAGTIYRTWVTQAATLWGAGFALTNGRWRAWLLTSTVSLVAHSCVEAKILDFRPDILACVHPLATRLAIHASRRANPTIPAATIVTDLAHPHASWFRQDVNILTVPTEAVQRHAQQAGIPSQSIVLTGQPVHPRFAEIDIDQRAARRAFGLAPDRFTVLLIGGGEGMGRVAEMARAIDNAGIPLQQVIVCGRNEALRQNLAAAVWRCPVQILGFVRNMPQLMHVSDVVATKAGPSTICEALVVGRPLLLIGYVPGQEQGNVDYVARAGAGQLIETPEAMQEALGQLHDAGSGVGERMRAEARRLAQPAAAEHIARLLASVAAGQPISGSTVDA